MFDFSTALVQLKAGRLVRRLNGPSIGLCLGAFMHEQLGEWLPNHDDLVANDWQMVGPARKPAPRGIVTGPEPLGDHVPGLRID